MDSAATKAGPASASGRVRPKLASVADPSRDADRFDSRPTAAVAPPIEASFRCPWVGSAHISNGAQRHAFEARAALQVDQP